MSRKLLNNKALPTSIIACYCVQRVPPKDGHVKPPYLSFGKTFWPIENKKIKKQLGNSTIQQLRN